MEELFKIYKVDTEEAENIKGSINVPHKHDFEELIIGLKGKLTHFIDYEVQEWDAPFISFVTKGKIHRVQPDLQNGQCDFWVIRFKSEFIPEITFHLYNSYHDQANFQLRQDSYLDRLDKICDLMNDEMKQASPELCVIRNLLSSLFIMIDVERKKSTEGQLSKLNNQNLTFQSFLAILEDNFRRSEGVNFYAEKLFMTPRALNTITQRILQQTVSEIIETRKLTEAKNLLFTTEKNIAEIGFELGYTDKAYFTSVFKKKSGLTPSEFRQDMRKHMD
ncbi:MULTISPECIES: AraC family transcriptional regulator [Sphingobacterium]|uniref:AraC family transcriptional regulator n=1 Tax=Sphingobacterium TaxID=28453 RepID=UPI0013DB751A|nr:MULTISPECIES: AraC family transcriptional regulator [unclassified Sphingobacterium]